MFTLDSPMACAEICLYRFPVNIEGVLCWYWQVLIIDHADIIAMQVFTWFFYFLIFFVFLFSRSLDIKSCYSFISLVYMWCGQLGRIGPMWIQLLNNWTACRLSSTVLMLCALGHGISRTFLHLIEKLCFL